MNIAILTPSQNPYSETFIQAHKNYLNGTIFYYYGTSEIKLEEHPPLATIWERRVLKIIQKLGKRKSTFVRDTVLLRSLKKHKVQVILVEYGVHAHRLLPILKKAQLPFAVHFHGYDASDKKAKENCQNYESLFGAASAVIAVSKIMEQMLLELGCAKEKLIYNVYGPRPEFLEVKPTFSKKQFIGIGRFTDKKAPYYTILAFKKVVEKYPDSKLLIAGDGALLNTCRNLVANLGLGSSVEFLGIISSERYMELLSESLAFVQHSITAESGDMEGTPLAILEASAAGIPVISTKHAGIPDVIIDGKTGLLCEEHEVNVMATDMLKLLDSVALAKEMGLAGKNNIRLNFSMERHINKLQSILENCK